MKIEIEFSEVDIKSSVNEYLSKRVRERIPFHGDHFRSEADTKIREVTKEVLGEIDIKPLVEKEIKSTLEKILSDTVRHQVKSIVRLAIQRELAAQKAELSGDDSQ